ncbi:hypothetical protein LTR85_003911 [Meristemomyces frigidus]|nr:hypothetical protein LTR85_003911 [Meristemomyces frigidus]
MTTYQGKCHCGHHQWDVTLQEDQSKHILCHCDTCKILGGGAFTMNQIIPKSALKITSGGEPGNYKYKGDSGNSVMGPDTIIARTALLPEARKKFDVGAEIYGKDKMTWEKEIATTFETLPPS